MKRWKQGAEIENEAIDSFIDDIKRVCRQHGMSISHEDGQGAFEIEAYSEDNLKWLEAAFDKT